MLYKGKEVKKINHLTPVKFCFKKGNDVYWLFKCDCGKEKIIAKHSVVSGHTKTCGCNMVPSEFLEFKNTRLYSIWRGMKDRCNLKNKSNYKYYGGRGIKVFDGWNKIGWRGFVPFYRWAIDNGYKVGLTLDRIDVNGNYCPENCRWIMQKEQAHNMRTNVFIEYNGEKHCITEWARILGIGRNTISRRIKKGLPVELILKKKG